MIFSSANYHRKPYCCDFGISRDFLKYIVIKKGTNHKIRTRVANQKQIQMHAQNCWVWERVFVRCYTVQQLILRCKEFDLSCECERILKVIF